MRSHPPKYASKPESNDGATVGVKDKTVCLRSGGSFGGRLIRTFATGENASSDKQREFYTLDNICYSRRARVIWQPSVLLVLRY